VTPLALGMLTCALISRIAGPAWAGAAQPAARQVPRTATRLAAAFLTALEALTFPKPLPFQEARGARTAAAGGRIGADFGVRADVGVPGMMTDLTYLGSSNVLTSVSRTMVRGLCARGPP